MAIKRTISRLVRGVLYLPITIYINFTALPFEQAIKMPFIVMGRTGVTGIKRGNLRIDGKIKTGMIRIGAQKTSKRGIAASGKTKIIISDGGLITFNGSASFGGGTSICAKGGSVIFGDRFSCNINCFIYSQKEIIFGEDTLLGWNVNVRDNDGHPLYDSDGICVNPDKPIIIGEHVWIASYVDIMKGVYLPNGSIVGTRSLVTKSFEKSNFVIAGVPAREIKGGIYWEHDLRREG